MKERRAKNDSRIGTMSIISFRKYLSWMGWDESNRLLTNTSTENLNKNFHYDERCRKEHCMPYRTDNNASKMRPNTRRGKTFCFFYYFECRPSGLSIALHLTVGVDYFYFIFSLIHALWVIFHAVASNSHWWIHIINYRIVGEWNWKLLWPLLSSRQPIFHSDSIDKG